MGDYSMDQHFEQALTVMEKAVHYLSDQVPRPYWYGSKKSGSFRYKEKSIHQAIVQKLARMVSTLHAARLLLAHNCYQEMWSLQRILDELGDDVFFLCSGVGNLTPLHEKYLDDFYFEEGLDAEDSRQRPRWISRNQIYTHNAKIFASNPCLKVDPNKVSRVSRTLHQTYSGYVHARSPHIMDMYGGNPPQFQIRGVLAPPHYQARRNEELTHYFSRGLFLVAEGTAAFAPTAWSDELRKYAAEFDDAFRGRPGGQPQ